VGTSILDKQFTGPSSFLIEGAFLIRIAPGEHSLALNSLSLYFDNNDFGLLPFPPFGQFTVLHKLFLL